MKDCEPRQGQNQPRSETGKSSLGRAINNPQPPAESKGSGRRLPPGEAEKYQRINEQSFRDFVRRWREDIARELFPNEPVSPLFRRKRLSRKEQERRDIEIEIFRLKKSRTMRGRITEAQFIQIIEPELLEKMQQYDPEFMNPIITGLKKRPARQEKLTKAIKRINPNLTGLGW